MIANLWIQLPAARPGQSWRFTPMTHSFFSACAIFWRNGETFLDGNQPVLGRRRDAAFPAGAEVPGGAKIVNAMPTYLNAMVAVGIVLASARRPGWSPHKPSLAVCLPGNRRRGDPLRRTARSVTGILLCCCCSVSLAASLLCRSMRCCRSAGSIPLAQVMRLQCRISAKNVAMLLMLGSIRWRWQRYSGSWRRDWLWRGVCTGDCRAVLWGRRQS